MLKAVVIACSTAVAGAGLMAVPTNASALAEGSVGGSVETESGQPMQGSRVVAYRYLGAVYGWEFETAALTGSDGRYSLEGLPAGRYRVGFDAGNGYIPEYWNDELVFEASDEVVVTATAPVSGIDADLAVGSRVTGSVSGPGGLPAAGVLVSALARNPVTSDWMEVGTAFTADNGTYDIDELPAGSYRIQFWGPRAEAGYAPAYWDAQTSLSSAAELEVPADATVSGINASLAIGGHINGTLTDGAGNPAPDVDVWAFRWDAAAQKWGDTVWVDDYWGATDASGNYDVRGLPPGRYRLLFQDFNTGTLAREYWGDSATLSGGTDVVITGSETVSGRNAQLTSGGTIAGTLTAPEGAQVSQVAPIAYILESTGWEPVGGAAVDTQGRFTLKRLHAGTYRIGFVDNAEVLTTEYWDNQSNLEAAADIVVTDGGATTGKDAQLEQATSTVPTPTPTSTPSSPSVSPPVSPPASSPVSSVTPTPGPTVAAIQAALASALADAKVAGRLKVGKTLKVKGLSSALALRSAVTYKFQWYVGRKAIKRATKSKLSITRSLRGKKLAVKVTASSMSVTTRKTLKVGKVS